jgi:acyl-coenzyme A thioesterase PaaI-like protein
VNPCPPTPHNGAPACGLFESTATAELDPVGIAALLEIRCPEVEDGRIVLTCKTRPSSPTRSGMLHGGIAATLLDSAMGCAVHTTLPANQGYSLAGHLGALHQVRRDRRRRTAGRGPRRRTAAGRCARRRRRSPTRGAS